MHDILIEEKVLAKNDEIAGENRALLRKQKIFSINMVSSPGAGKTAIIERSVPFLKEKLGSFAVVEGDLQNDLDAKRISRFGIPVKQITTGKACHLDAHNISHILPWVIENGPRLLIIENVGNMVCPAEYDLGEDLMVMVMSTAEGDDKPLKYPAIFSAADVLILNKIDLAPYTDFNINTAKENALKINPHLKIFETSCRTGEGIPEWSDFLSNAVTEK